MRRERRLPACPASRLGEDAGKCLGENQVIEAQTAVLASLGRRAGWQPALPAANLLSCLIIKDHKFVGQTYSAKSHFSASAALVKTRLSKPRLVATVSPNLFRSCWSS